MSDREILATRLTEAGLIEERLVPVDDGTKACKISHNDASYRESSFASLSGNYGVYAGANPSGDRWLVDIDIDDYSEDAGGDALEAVNDLPDTFTVESPHTNGVTGGHRYYYINGREVHKSIERVAGAFNPGMSWGEIRVHNQYVVGPGSQLNGCGKEWCDECKKPDGGFYQIATDAPIAEITLPQLFKMIEPDESDESTSQAGGSVNTSGSTPDLDGDMSHAKAVAKHYSNIENYLLHGSDDRSESDFHVCCRFIEHGVAKDEAYRLLADNPRTKVDAADTSSDYWHRTWQRAKQKIGNEANTENLPSNTCPDGGSATVTTLGGDNDQHTGRDGVREMFVQACKRYNIDHGRVGKQTRDGETVVVGVNNVVPETTVGDAVMSFTKNADLLEGTEKQAVVGRVVLLDLRESGEFFKTDDERVFYFYDPENKVYRVDGNGSRTLTEEFQALVHERYNLFSGRFSRNPGQDIKTQATRDAPTKEVYQFAHYNETEGELYISDWDSGYYAISTETIEWRSNGSDVYFLSEGYADPYEYLSPTERGEIPSQIPGERPTWLGRGDPLMRVFGNRINYNEGAALGPSEQRKQLYLHLHTLPFVDLLNARPIMAWVGEKGSGKTVVERSIGRFIFGEEFRESTMPSDKDDFLAKVTNQALAFVDNYDDGEDWANDVLAAIATGAGIDKRELYTTNTLRREVPRCWLSVTSRDPPFRRDDVADRTLVFRVARVEDGFVGMGDYLRQVDNYWDLLWSTYLDNLQQILREYHTRNTEAMSSSHRMADWAIFAQITADALEVDRVDDLLETMETERATFALENEPWANTIGEWIRNNPEEAAKWRKASSLCDCLDTVVENGGFGLNAPGLGGKLSTYHGELGELYGLEIDTSGRTNKYRFDVGDDTSPTSLKRY